jgi:phage host-nuclease inhibitor protein Gam
MEKIEEIVKEVERIQKELKMAHQAIDDYYSGKLQPMMGFGPYTQSEIISGCNARLDELKGELVKLGISAEIATALCSDQPPTGKVYEECLAFIANNS